MENPGLTISPCEVLNPATLLPTPEGSLPFHSCLETLDQREPRWPLELLGGSQAPRRAVCGTRGSLRTVHGLNLVDRVPEELMMEV